MKRLQIAVLLVATSLGVAAVAQTPHSHEHSFQGADQWARYFDDPARDEWQKPHQVIQALHLAPDARVADIGAGTGYFSVRLAHMTPKGRVYAVDVEPDMVKYLADRAKREKLTNLQAVQSSSADPRLPEKVDRVLLVDVYHHIGERVEYFKNLREYLKSNARVAIIDFHKDSRIGPPASDRLPAEQVIAEMKQAGYSLAATNDFLPNQYYLIFNAR
jgi:cyclopropane fatty-acyl-phospholipid synthase-like methyltransferase